MRRLLIRRLLNAVLIVVVVLVCSTAVTAAVDSITESIPGGKERASSAVVLSSYHVSQGSLLAGGRITLAFQLENTSRTEIAADIILSYACNENTLYPIFGETNTSYVDLLTPGESVDVHKEFNISGLAPETLEFTINLKYREMGGASGYSGQESKIFLPVFSKNSLNIKLNVGNTVYAGTPAMITGYCTNAGLHDLYDLSMDITGDIDGGGNDVYLGDLPKGGQISLQEIVSFGEVGMNKNLLVIFSFLDKEGNKYQLLADEYLVTVLESPSGSRETQGEQASVATLNDAIVPILLIFAAVLVAITMIWYFIRRNNTD